VNVADADGHVHGQSQVAAREGAEWLLFCPVVQTDGRVKRRARRRARRP
jgi:hypothetical protein